MSVAGVVAGRRRHWWRPMGDALARFFRHPQAVWRGSLPLRVVVTTVLATTVVLVLAGFLLMQQAADGVVSGKRRAAMAEAEIAFDSAQAQMYTGDLAAGNVNEILSKIAIDLDQRGAVGGQYHVLVQGSVSSFRSGSMEPESVPASLATQVGSATGIWAASTQIVYTDGRTEAGWVVGSALNAPGAGRFPVYLVFPMSQEQETLQVLRGAVITTWAILVVALGLISASIARQVVIPVRAAREAAEALASGNMADRMVVRGSDDVARLAASMNNMASELQTRISQLENLSQVQQQFVSDVSHELRTPLTTVRMAGDFIYEARDDFDPATRRSTELLHNELDRFASLLDDLLEISRFDAGAAVLTTATIDLVEVVEAEVEAQHALAESKDTPILVHAEGPTYVEADSRRIQRIMRNLITNAIEHGESRPIDITVLGDERAAAITVRDHGVGFEAEQARMVFHRFWRGDPSRARTVGGTGLGLAISMEDARLHGGTLNAWGRPGQGAQFRLTIPRTPGGVVEVPPLPVVPRDILEAQALGGGRLPSEGPAGDGAA
ncbi:signal transduction histidine kinase [Raineyella antarctica]|uniref:Sensor histidine kinase MtrB n=1 Tax=Raineyella antarctica TaxID=1577474 RepID=A0A1G6GW45_9ACTN|nr:MtrAB system histidine kinase MtrB [Raineyella antarctica]SDB86093.1 signal transduction histidine kinase [Raineyella antarctica]